MKSNPTLIAAFAIMLFISSCKMYYIPVDSFKQQFAGLDRSRRVYTKEPWGSVVGYETYPLDSIKCQDDKGIWYLLANGPSIEIRFTQKNGKRTVFYFDRIMVGDTWVSGEKSRIFTSITAKIPLDSIKLIEVQDGRKRYTYIK